MLVGALSVPTDMTSNPSSSSQDNPPVTPTTPKRGSMSILPNPTGTLTMTNESGIITEYPHSIDPKSHSRAYSVPGIKRLSEFIGCSEDYSLEKMDWNLPSTGTSLLPSPTTPPSKMQPQMARRTPPTASMNLATSIRKPRTPGRPSRAKIPHHVTGERRSPSLQSTTVTSNNSSFPRQDGTGPSRYPKAPESVFSDDMSESTTTCDEHDHSLLGLESPSIGTSTVVPFSFGQDDSQATIKRPDQSSSNAYARVMEEDPFACPGTDSAGQQLQDPTLLSAINQTLVNQTRDLQHRLTVLTSSLTRSQSTLEQLTTELHVAKQISRKAKEREKGLLMHISALETKISALDTKLATSTSRNKRTLQENTRLNGVIRQNALTVKDLQQKIDTYNVAVDKARDENELRRKLRILGKEKEGLVNEVEALKRQLKEKDDRVLKSFRRVNHGKDQADRDLAGIMPPVLSRQLKSALPFSPLEISELDWSSSTPNLNSPENPMSHLQSLINVPTLRRTRSTVTRRKMTMSAPSITALTERLIGQAMGEGVPKWIINEVVGWVAGMMNGEDKPAIKDVEDGQKAKRSSLARLRAAIQSSNSVIQPDSAVDVTLKATQFTASSLPLKSTSQIDLHVANDVKDLQQGNEALGKENTDLKRMLDDARIAVEEMRRQREAEKQAVEAERQKEAQQQREQHAELEKQRSEQLTNLEHERQSCLRKLESERISLQSERQHAMIKLEADRKLHLVKLEKERKDIIQKLETEQRERMLNLEEEQQQRLLELERERVKLEEVRASSLEEVNKLKMQLLLQQEALKEREESLNARLASAPENVSDVALRCSGVSEQKESTIAADLSVSRLSVQSKHGSMGNPGMSSKLVSRHSLASDMQSPIMMPETPEAELGLDMTVEITNVSRGPSTGTLDLPHSESDSAKRESFDPLRRSMQLLTSASAGSRLSRESLGQSIAQEVELKQAAPLEVASGVRPLSEPQREDPSEVICLAAAANPSAASMTQSDRSKGVLNQSNISLHRQSSSTLEMPMDIPLSTNTPDLNGSSRLVSSGSSVSFTPPSGLKLQGRQRSPSLDATQNAADGKHRLDFSADSPPNSADKGPPSKQARRQMVLLPPSPTPSPAMDNRNSLILGTMCRAFQRDGAQLSLTDAKQTDESIGMGLLSPNNDSPGSVCIPSPDFPELHDSLQRRKDDMPELHQTLKSSQMKRTRHEPVRHTVEPVQISLASDEDSTPRDDTPTPSSGSEPGFGFSNGSTIPEAALEAHQATRVEPTESTNGKSIPPSRPRRSLWRMMDGADTHPYAPPSVSTSPYCATTDPVRRASRDSATISSAQPITATPSLGMWQADPNAISSPHGSTQTQSLPRTHSRISSASYNDPRGSIRRSIEAIQAFRRPRSSKTEEQITMMHRDGSSLAKIPMSLQGLSFQEQIRRLAHANSSSNLVPRSRSSMVVVEPIDDDGKVTKPCARTAPVRSDSLKNHTSCQSANADEAQPSFVGSGRLYSDGWKERRVDPSASPRPLPKLDTSRAGDFQNKLNPTPSTSAPLPQTPITSPASPASSFNLMSRGVPTSTDAGSPKRRSASLDKAIRSLGEQGLWHARSVSGGIAFLGKRRPSATSEVHADVYKSPNADLERENQEDRPTGSGDKGRKLSASASQLPQVREAVRSPSHRRPLLAGKFKRGGYLQHRPGRGPFVGGHANPVHPAPAAVSQPDLTTATSNISLLPPPPASTFALSTPIQFLTQTMIGGWLYKFNRKGRSPHMRFFWIHPYSFTLCWSKREPGGRKIYTKSVHIRGAEEHVLEQGDTLQGGGVHGRPRSRDDNEDTDARQGGLDPSMGRSTVVEGETPGAFERLILVKTPDRTLQLMALTGSDHITWLKGIDYLMTRLNSKDPLAPDLSGEIPGPLGVGIV